MIRQILLAAVAAATLGGAVAASAQDRGDQRTDRTGVRHDGGMDRHDGNRMDGRHDDRMNQRHTVMMHHHRHYHHRHYHHHHDNGR